MIGNNEINFPHELLLTDRQNSSLHKSLNLFKIIYHGILSCQKHNYQRLFSQEDFLVDYLVHY